MCLAVAQMTDIVLLARRLSRQLMLEKGMSFDAESLALLAAIGVNDLVQAKAAEYLGNSILDRAS